MSNNLFSRVSNILWARRVPGCLSLVFLVVPEDWREASRVERGLVGVVISSIVVSRVVAVGRVVARVVVVPRGIHRIPSVAKSKVFLLEERDYDHLGSRTLLLIISLP